MVELFASTLPRRILQRREPSLSTAKWRRANDSRLADDDRDVGEDR